MKTQINAISFAHFCLFEIELPIRYIGNVGRLFSNPNGTELDLSRSIFAKEFPSRCHGEWGTYYNSCLNLWT